MDKLLNFIFELIIFVGASVLGVAIFALFVIFILGVAFKVFQSGISILKFLAEKFKVKGFYEEEVSSESDSNSKGELISKREQEEFEEIGGLLEELLENVYKHTEADSKLYEKALSIHFKMFSLVERREGRDE